MLGSFWDHFGSILEQFRDHFGIILGPCSDYFGIMLGSFWDLFGNILGSFWEDFRINLSNFGELWVALGLRACDCSNSEDSPLPPLVGTRHPTEKQITRTHQVCGNSQNKIMNKLNWRARDRVRPNFILRVSPN